MLTCHAPMRANYSLTGFQLTVIITKGCNIVKQLADANIESRDYCLSSLMLSTVRLSVYKTRENGTRPSPSPKLAVSIEKRSGHTLPCAKIVPLEKHSIPDDWMLCVARYIAGKLKHAGHLFRRLMKMMLIQLIQNPAFLALYH